MKHLSRLFVVITLGAVDCSAEVLVPEQSSGTSGAGASGSGGGGNDGGGGSDGGGTSSGGDPGPYWSRSFGGAGAQRARAVAADLAGNVFVTGTFEGDVDFGGGPLSSAGDGDVFLVKLDPKGKHLWSKRFGDAALQEASGLAVDSLGNIILAAHVNGAVDLGGGPLPETAEGDAVLAKFDGSGNHLWSKRFGGALEQEIKGVAVDASGNIVVTGTFANTVDFGSGPLVSAGDIDVFVAKLDGASNHLWSERMGGIGDQLVSAIAVGPAGGIVIAGGYFEMIDFGGGIALKGIAGHGYLASLGPKGAPAWARDGHGGWVEAVAVDGAGRIAVTGSAWGTLDFGGGPADGAGDDLFLVELGAGGEHRWTKRIGNGGSQRAYGVGVNGAGDVLFTGECGGTLDFGGGPIAGMELGSSLFLAKYSATGGHLWSKRYGAGPYNVGNSIALDGAGNTLVAGSFSGTLDFGFGAHVDPGMEDDAFVAKLLP